MRQEGNVVNENAFPCLGGIDARTGHREKFDDFEISFVCLGSMAC